MEESEIKEKYMELQLFDQQIKNAHQQIQTLEQQLMELNNVLLTLDEVKKLEKNAEILIPLTTGIYAKGTLQDTSEFTVNVGADVAVKKDFESTKKLINQQIQEVTQVQQKMVVEVQEIVTKAKKIQELLKDVLEKD